MKRKILNILVIFFIVFISIFVNKKVEAANSLICNYYSPMPIINTKTNRITNVTFGSDIPITLILKCDFKNGTCESKYSYISNTNKLLSKEEKKLNLLGSANIGYRNFSDSIHISNPMHNFNYNVTFSLTEEATKSKTCPDYIKMDFDYRSANHKIDISIGTKKSYINSINNRYTDVKNKFNFDNEKSYLLDYMNYISSIKTITYINTDLSEKYPDYDTTDEYPSRLAKFKAVLDKRDGGKASYEKLPIDLEDTNSRTISKTLYEQTITSYDTFMKDYEPYFGIDMSDEERQQLEKTLGFEYDTHQRLALWFYQNGRYLFEQDIKKFRDYFAYIYDGWMDETDYKNFLIAIDDGLISYESAEKKENCLDDNICNVYCTTYADGQCSGQAWDACTATNGNSDYTKCNNSYNSCTKKAIDECLKYKNKAYDACISNKDTRIDTCMRKELGEEVYKKLKEEEANQREKIKEEKEKSLDKFIYGLSKIASPNLNIDFDKHEVISCDDVIIFRSIYLIMRVCAPIALILFSTIDYAKAVLSADLDKLNKSKKSLPKRLLLLVLFLFVPIIISLLIKIFDVPSNHLMTCIINGE